MKNHKIYIEPLGITRGSTVSRVYCREIQNSGLFYSLLRIIYRSNQEVNEDIIPVYEIDGYIAKLNNEDASYILNLIDNLERERKSLKLKEGLEVNFDRPIIQGVLNVTPDSFSDGGKFNEYGSAINLAKSMFANGAGIIDIGGESTKPGAKPVSGDEELNRVLPVIKKLAHKGMLLSIDSRNSQIMKMAIKSGAHIINDVSALEYDTESTNIVRDENVPVILMHAQGAPENMQDDPNYQCVYLDIYDYLEDRIDHCVKNGIPKNKIIVDPGIGFGKTVEHNLQILNHIALFHGLGVPLLIGVSRKSFIGKITGEANPLNRVNGSIAAAQYCIERGTHIVRVHDVNETKQAMMIWQNIAYS